MKFQQWEEDELCWSVSDDEDEYVGLIRPAENYGYVLEMTKDWDFSYDELTEIRDFIFDLNMEKDNAV